jgi:DNA-binding winged helix-turn-helix (wHTH) protein
MDGTRFLPVLCLNRAGRGLGSRARALSLRRMDADKRNAIHFGDWRFLREPLELFRGEHRIRIQEQPLAILDALLAQPGALVKREELIARLWPRTVTDYEAGLHTAVRKLRAVLDDDAEAPRFIETVPRQGYRFIGKVDRAPTPSAEVPARVPTNISRKTIGMSVLLFILMAATTGWWVVREDSLSARKLAARELWLAGVLAWQNLGGGGMTAAETARIEDLYDRAIAADPELWEAHADRARVRMARFISGSDTSDASVAAARAGLERARELAGARAYLLVREAQVAYFFDNDLNRALELFDQAEALEPLSGEQLMSKAIFLGFARRPEQAWPTYERAAKLDPGNPTIYRFWMADLFVAHRPVEALRVARQYDARMPGRLERGEWLFSYTGDTRRWRMEIESANHGGLANALSNEFDLLRMERRLEELHQLVSRPEPALFRPHSPVRNIVGAFDRPKAQLVAWERLLAGDYAAAAAAGRELQQFVDRQNVRTWNLWALRLMEAEATLMLGDRPKAVELAREALASQMPNPNHATHIYARLMAAAFSRGPTRTKRPSRCLLN